MLVSKGSCGFEGGEHSLYKPIEIWYTIGVNNLTFKLTKILWKIEYLL